MFVCLMFEHSENYRGTLTDCRNWRLDGIWAATCDFQQCGILTSVDSDKPVQPPVMHRNSKWCSVSSLTVIEYSSDKQMLWSVWMHAQVDQSLCWSQIPQFWKSHVTAHMEFNHSKCQVMRVTSSRAVYTVCTGARGCQQRQVLWDGYLKQTQLESSSGQNHRQGKQVTQIYELSPLKQRNGLSIPGSFPTGVHFNSVGPPYQR